jgi:hypothetical protein
MRAYSPEQDAGHFLMADLAGTHFQTTNVIDAMGGRVGFRRKPQLTQMIDTIARFPRVLVAAPGAGAVALSDSPRLSLAGGHENDVMAVNRREELERFFASAGADLAGDVRQLYAADACAVYHSSMSGISSRGLVRGATSRSSTATATSGSSSAPRTRCGQVYLMEPREREHVPGSYGPWRSCSRTFWTPQASAHERESREALS